MALALYSVLSLFTTNVIAHSITQSFGHYEPNLQPSNSEQYCSAAVNKSGIISPESACVNTLGCGWCYNNQTKGYSCDYMGVCFYRGHLNDYTECEILDSTITCNFIRLIGFFILLGVITTSMSCSLRILRYFIETTNCFSCVYFTGLISALFYSLIPVFMLYYTSFTTFCITTLVQLTLSVLLWLCGDTETVRRVYINKNHSEYQRIPDGETGALVN